MKPFFKGLDTETQLLVSIGAAVASGCIPCLERMVDMAKSEDIEPKKLKAAAVIGQFIKDQPASHMKDASDRLLGTHLRSNVNDVSCPMAGDEQKTSAKNLENLCSCR